MRNKKSVLMTLSVSYDYSNEAVTGIAGNGRQLTEGGFIANIVCAAFC